MNLQTTLLAFLCLCAATVLHAEREIGRAHV